MTAFIGKGPEIIKPSSTKSQLQKFLTLFYSTSSPQHIRSHRLQIKTVRYARHPELGICNF
ncbi:MAG: hypothetical protein ABIO98_08065, partial [Chitinophagales bacterium]